MANIKEQAAAVNMMSNARLTAAQVINSVFSDGAYANIALGKALSKQNHSERDRRFVTELVYGTVKAKGTIDWLLQQLVSRPLGKIEPMILNILRLGVFQIYFLERILANATVTKDVEPYTVVGGVPAHYIKHRFDKKTIEKLLEIKWWDWDYEKIYDAIPLLQSGDVDQLINEASKDDIVAFND